jgi:hypothetical protein
MMFSLATLTQLLGLWQRILDAESRGVQVWQTIKAAVPDQGAESDTAALDAVIADAQRRRDIAEREANGTASAAELGVHAGSNGD